MTDLDVLRFQSNGLGQQSAALYAASCLELLPRLTYSITADPGKEKRGTYKYLDWLQGWQKEIGGVPIKIMTGKNLYKDLMNGVNSTNGRFASIPAFTKNEDGSTGMLRRQCTYEYKILEFNRAVREITNKPSGRMPKAEIWMAITVEEMDRMEIPTIKGFTNVYPFCGFKIDSYGKIHTVDYLPKKWTRSDCINYLTDNNLPVPPKSACTFCPFMGDDEWAELKEDPKEWPDIVALDKSIRNSSQNGLDSEIFLHESLKPIDEIEFKKSDVDMFGNKKGYCKGSFCNI